MIVQQKFYMYVCISRVQVLMQNQIVGIKSLGFGSRINHIVRVRVSCEIIDLVGHCC